MNFRWTTVARLALLGATSSVLIVCSTGWGFAEPQSTPPSSAKPSGTATTDAAKTEDIILTTDGRELHGKIISETRTQVVFEYVDAKMKVKSTITLDVDKIAQIKRNVPLPPAEKPAATGTETSGSTTASGDTKPTDKTKAPERSRGFVTRVGKDSKDVPSFYIVPVRGQVGTDVVSDTYVDVAKDIQAVKPDVVIIKMDCKDFDQSFATALGNVNPSEIGMLDFDDGHKFVNLFQNELRQFKQVLWVNDSVGMSSTLAMSWKDIYMTPNARFGGMVMVLAQSGAKSWPDPDVRAKMYAAWTGGAKSFLEYGGYSPTLGDAMIDPEYSLSATWKGREVIWSLDTNGEYVVDNDDQRPTNFTAKMAEDFCISKGTVENLDDLALMLGYREYRMADGQAEKIVREYLDDWRRAFDDAKQALEKYQQFMGWASGADEVKYLGQAKTQLEKALACINRFKAVEKRMQKDMGVDKQSLTVFIERINERLRALKGSSNKPGMGSSGRGGSGRAGSGGRGGEGG